MSKINSEISFLYQLFKENSNFIVLKPCNLIHLPIFYFHFFLFMYLLGMYTPSNQHFKAFPESKINFETSFLSQLFKDNSNLRVLKPCTVIYLSFFMIFIVIYIYSYVYLCIYTPSNQHFKAFPLSKFNSETSFLYQLFKEDSNFRVKKPCKVIYLSAYDVFLKPCKIIYLSIFFTIHLFFMNTRGLRLLHCT